MQGVSFFVGTLPKSACAYPSLELNAAARLKDAVDLDAVRDDLSGMVQAALEPAHISIWIGPG